MRGGWKTMLAALVAGAIASGAAQAQLEARTYEQQFVEFVQSALFKEAEALTRQGFEPANRALIEMNKRADVRRFILRLEAGTTYALIGVCDQDCSHVTLTIFDDTREPMTASRERSGVVVLSGTPERSGNYVVELALPGCRERSCHTGFVVMHQGGPAPAEGVVVAQWKDGAQRPAVAGAQIGMERRPGVEIQGGNYREIRGTTIAECERQCLTDSRCRAVEFYTERGSCGLFDRTPQMRRARGIDASVKVGAAD